MKKDGHRCTRVFGGLWLASLLVAAITEVPCALADVYRWVDDNGKVHFADAAPEQVASDATVISAAALTPKNTYSTNATKPVTPFKDSLALEQKNRVVNSSFEGEGSWVLHPHMQLIAEPGNTLNQVLKIQAPSAQAQLQKAITAEQCINVAGVAALALSAKFFMNEIPANAFANELQLVWHADKRCEDRGQFGEYLRPRLKAGWQEPKIRHAKVDLGAQSVTLKVVQNGRAAWAGNGAQRKPLLVYWDDIALTPVEWENIDDDARQLYKAVDSNLVSNARFDSDTEHWRLDDYAKWKDLGDFVHGGVLYSALNYLDDKSAASPYASSVVYYCVDLGAASLIDFKLEAKWRALPKEGASARASLVWFDGVACNGRSRSVAVGRLKSVAGWQSLSRKDIPRPRQAKSVRIGIRHSMGATGESHLMLDNIGLIVRDNFDDAKSIDTHRNKSAKHFLNENALRSGVVRLASGLQYEILSSKSGRTPRPVSKKRVKVHYEMMLLDGTVIDSSRRRGSPLTFPVGGVIAGWREALTLMSVGDRWKLYIPSELAYGQKGGPQIPSNAVLISDVELLEAR